MYLSCGPSLKLYLHVKSRWPLMKLIILLFCRQCQLSFLVIPALRVADWYFSCLLSLFCPFFILERERMRTKIDREKGQCNTSFNRYKNVSFNLWKIFHLIFAITLLGSIFESYNFILFASYIVYYDPEH